MPPGRTLTPVAIVLVVAGLSLTVGSRLVGSGGDSPAPTPEPSYAAPAPAPLRNPAPATASIADLPDPGWLQATSAASGIPRSALAAYAGAALRKAEQMPGCGISWNTLAAIGWVESKHGSHGGSVISGDGTIAPGIYGVALDGSATDHIPDSDEGRFDGDEDYDRAVGPMQMIPQSWRNWRTDADADGTKDPQNVYDAVMAAADYLCRATQGTDMIAVTGWRQGIASYNSAPSYLHAVARKAIEYGGF